MLDRTLSSYNASRSYTARHSFFTLIRLPDKPNLHFDMSWTHTPRLPIVLWALWAFPFTVWDAAYIFLRPHTMPGGVWHEPFFRPMVQWATVDRIYGEHAWLKKEGFTAAQGVINVLEISLYMVYLMIVHRNGGALRRASFGGRPAAWAVLVGFAAGVVTATKTSLYCAFERCEHPKRRVS